MDKLASKSFTRFNFSFNSPFLAAGWVNLESHRCCDETVVFFIEHVKHFKWTSILNVSIASEFNSIEFMAECKGSVLKWDACSELSVKQAYLLVRLCGCEVNNCKDLIGTRKKSISFITIKSLFIKNTYGKCCEDFHLHFNGFLCTSVTFCSELLFTFDF